MTEPRPRPRTAGLISFCAALALLGARTLAVDAPDPAWDAGAYYDGVIGNGSLSGTMLRTQLQALLSKNDADVPYDQEKLSMPITDRVYGTAASAKKMSGVYDRKELAGVWDAAKTWNREHVWPQSKLGGNSDHDMFGLRPAFVQSNGDRANYGYGGANINDATAAGNLAKNKGATFPLFYAGQYDKGDVARACFYMATRYYVPGSPNSAASLKIVDTTDGYNPDGTMGDLNSMLHWHYQDPVDNFERRRNQYIFSNPEQTKSTGNLSQNNRNPYVDHPEYVWSVFGDGANDSQITVNSNAVGGASSKSVNFGRVIVGAAVPTLGTAVTLSKTGVDPTTFSISTSGLATADGVNNAAVVRTNNLNTFNYAAQSKTLNVGLNGVSTATAGVKGGTVTIDNTDITTQSSVANSGSADGDDTVDLSLLVLDHAHASFDTAGDAGDADTLFMNFQAVNRGTTRSARFSLANLLADSGYSAGLDLDSITATGDTGVFGTDLSAFTAMTAGTSRDFMATFTPNRSGSFYATYTLAVSDEDLAGAAAGTSLTLVMSGVANARSLPEPMILSLTPALAMLLRRRRAA